MSKGNIWNDLKAAKSDLADEVIVKMGEQEVSIPIKFVDFEDLKEIEDRYEDMKPDKPTIKVDVGGKQMRIQVPNSDEKYEAFNTHKKAKEWLEEVKPIDKKKQLEMAYVFIEDDYKPGETKEEGLEILEDSLRQLDVAEIIQQGQNLMGLSDRLKKARKNS